MGLKNSMHFVIQLLKSPIRRILYRLGIRKYETTATYSRVIPAEITSGEFYRLIKEISANNEVVTILEIGSSSGEGSTQALLESISSRLTSAKKVFCLEISKERFNLLAEYVNMDKRFIPLRMSSVSIADFPTLDEVLNFHSNSFTNLSKIHRDTVKSWYRKDVQYLIENPEVFADKNPMDPQSGAIQWIKKQHRIEYFDFVIIDGGEFTGFVELKQTFGARYIALDDVNSFKCFDAHQYLLDNPNYRLISSNLKDRNGWSVFSKLV